MATASGKKVEIGKGRQNDNEEGKPKRYDKWQRKQGHKIFCKVGRKEVRAMKKQIPEKNGSEK